MSSPVQHEVQQHQVFPTRVTTILHKDTEEMNAGLLELFDGGSKYRDQKFLETADHANLMDLCDKVPALARLRDLFIEGLRHWARAERVSGDYEAELLMFPVYSLPGQFVPAHNHLAHVSAVYYARTDDFSARGIIEYGDAAEYFKPEGGVLLLHDPRFNANLMDLTERDSVKFYPRPGLMVVMPGYLWHSGTPNTREFNRLAIVGDFLLHNRQSRHQKHVFGVKLDGG